LANHYARVRNLAIYVTAVLWPNLRLVKEGSYTDAWGVDAFEGKLAVQIKGDQAIAKQRNVYHELFERTQGVDGEPWRVSPHKADVFIFVTRGLAVRMTTDLLATRTVGRRITRILPTSMGVLIPLQAIRGPGVEIREHALWEDIA
jgi:hypothetical protein